MENRGVCRRTSHAGSQSIECGTCNRLSGGFILTFERFLRHLVHALAVMEMRAVRRLSLALSSVVRVWSMDPDNLFMVERRLFDGGTDARSCP